MAVKAISSTKLTDTLTISEYHDGYWLYDSTRGMNLAMRAKTERDAFVEAITYYQKLIIETNKELKNLNNAIDVFISSVSDNE
jgi:hypothetical protein